jgi:hypothetical protein
MKLIVGKYSNESKYHTNGRKNTGTKVNITLILGKYRNKCNITLMVGKYRNKSKYHTIGREIQERKEISH